MIYIHTHTHTLSANGVVAIVDNSQVYSEYLRVNEDIDGVRVHVIS